MALILKRVSCTSENASEVLARPPQMKCGTYGVSCTSVLLFQRECGKAAASFISLEQYD